MTTLWQDARFALRLIVGRPGFSLIVILALGLGIGANTAIFSVVNGVLLQPLSFKEPERLVRIWEKSKEFEQNSVSYLNFRDWHEQNSSLERLAAYRGQDYTLTGINSPEQVNGYQVSSEFFSTLGVAPALGRDFQQDEDQPGVPLTAIVSDGFWKTRLGGDPAALGRTITFNGNPYTVIGVLPPSFHFLDRGDFYVGIHNFRTANTESRAIHPGIRVIGRLRTHVTNEQAMADMTSIAEALSRQFPASNDGYSISMKPLREAMVGDVRPLLVILALAVGMVLLIACANVASLLLASSAARWREIAIRVALGAGRPRIVRQLLTESTLLAIAGGAVGLALAWLGTGAALKLVPDAIPRASDVGMDKWVLGFALLASVCTGVLFGLAPALQASRPNLNESLKEGARGSTGGRHRILSGFVVGEIALTLVLLASAGLLLRTFITLQGVNPGFEARNVLTFQVAATGRNYTEPENLRRFLRNVAENVRTIPGVASAGLTTLLPLGGDDSETAFYRNDRPRPPLSELPSAMFYITGPGYTDAMHIPLLRGRFFTEQDGQKAPLAGVIDTNMERLYFQDEDPLGKHINLPLGADASFDLEIVGVVGHVKQENLDSDAGSTILPQLYMPFDQVPDKFFSNDISGLGIVARTASNPPAYLPAIREKVHELDKDVPVFEVHSLEEVVATSLARRRFILELLGAFAMLALVLAAVGIYGVMAYSVSQRTHEIGIRMALGAERSMVSRMVIGHSIKLALIGVAIGGGGAVLATRLISGMLYQVSAHDPLTFAAVAGTLTLVAVAASYLPARRAMRVDPMIALRWE